jgi:arabinogalactan endo-1,4-beta-galactosidase
MKRRILLLSIVLVSFTAFSFAADAPAISKNVISSFNKQFTNAHDVKWEDHATFVKAQFSINDIVLYAYFNHSGELIAVSRFISPNQLPLVLLNSLKKEYSSGYWVSDLFEIETETGTSYFATYESADQTVILKSDGINGWITFQKDKKDHAE